MHQAAVCICSDQYIFGDSWGVQRPPPDVGGRERIVHIHVELVRKLAREDIENANGAIEAPRGDVLVIIVKTNAHGLRGAITERELVEHLDFTVVALLDVLVGRRGRQVLILLRLIGHHLCLGLFV